MATNSTAQALRDTLISPNVPDSNMEPANVVDVIAGAGINISRAIDRLARAMEHVAEAIAERPEKVTQ